MNSIVRIEGSRDVPPDAFLDHPPQDLRSGFTDPAAPMLRMEKARWIWRAAVFLPAIATTILIVALFTDFFAMDGISGFEALLISLVGFTLFWIALSVSMAIVGLLRGANSDPQIETGAPMTVALVVPVHNESPSAVFGNALAMVEALADTDTKHRFSLFILSDTRDPELLVEEARAFSALRLSVPQEIAVYYRSFPENTGKKIGNISQWVRQWGAGFEAMVVLDADSLMTASAVLRLANAMSADPYAGLIQSTPRIIGSRSVFGRVQQFSTRVYGHLLSAGLATWTRHEGNYWGHNAIIRTRAFAASAGLPRIGRRQDLILSHDFVEAALLRRAGWSVRMLPAAEGSFEEAPETLVDYVRRDARWCRGNLQHLRLLSAKQLHPVSRFHLFQGAMSYLVSPIWLVLLFVWAAIGVGEERSLIVYFSGNDPRPNWPELTGARQVMLLLFMYGMLLAPKLLGTLRALAAPGLVRRFGGAGRFSLSVLTEVILSVAYAPILMVQQTNAVIGSFIGWKSEWSTYRGDGQSAQSLHKLLRFHIVESVIGFLLILGIATQFVTLWLLPIGLSLLASIPLSMFSGRALAGFDWLMATPEDVSPPPVLRAARMHRTAFQQWTDQDLKIAAE